MKAQRAILLEAVSTGVQASEHRQSMPEQDERLREIAARLNWNIVDVILVPGHSRVYYTYLEFAQAALEEGIPGPMRMFDHWKTCDFDIFACSSGDRFGREQSIFAEVVGRTIDCDAVVYTLRDGEINRGNRRMFISMGGYQASTEIDELKRRHNFGMNRRAERGLPLSPKVPFSHRVIRDDNGKAVKMVVKEELRPLFNALAEVLLDRVTWQSLETELFERFGTVAKNGKRYPRRYFYRHLTSPVWWGHNARNHTKRNLKRGPWLIDENKPAPDEVNMFYNTHEPVYSGDLGDAVKAEILRRMSLRGSARPNTKYPLSGLFACAECGYKMAFLNQAGHWRAGRCNTAYGANDYFKGVCNQRSHMPEIYALDYMRDLVGLVVGRDDVLQVLQELDGTPTSEDETPELERQLSSLEEEGRLLIQKQIRAPASMSTLYDEQIDILGERVESLRGRLAALQHRKPSAHVTTGIQAAATDIRQLGEMFWEQPPGKISQTLRRLFAGRLFLVREGKIIGVKKVI